MAGTGSAGGRARTIASTLGVVAIVLALFVSGYAAMGAGIVGVGFSLAGGRAARGLPLVLCIVGAALGLGAQVLKAVAVRMH
jgi:hypothetical protein